MISGKCDKISVGARADKLAMQLYESLTEGEENTLQDKYAILRSVKQQALQNFTHRFRDDIKILVCAQRFEILQEAIEDAKAEEKLKRPREQCKQRYNISEDNSML